MNENYQTPDSSLLGDLDAPVHIPPVSKGIRFANLILDAIVIGIINFALTKLLLLADIDPNPTPAAPINGVDMAYFQALMGVFVRSMILGMVYNIAYYTITEGALQGRSIGKLITGTQAVNTTDYTPVTFPQALVRSLCRQIPFEGFAALFVQPWHDTISKTTVILKRK